MNITVVGTGYVGLVTGCCLAEAGHDVVCVDNNEAKVSSLLNGKTPIFEPGLEDYLGRNIATGRLSFTTSLQEGVKNAEAIFLALPTPPHEDGSADLSAVLAVAQELGRLLPAHYCVVINKSTVPVGTAEKVHAALSASAQSDFDVVSNPEFLREGLAVRDFMEPERIVVGVDSDKAEKVMRELYAAFINDERPFLVMDRPTAELAKYAANTFLVTKISFMNEISQICERVGANVDHLRKAIGYDSRIGHKFLYAGIGYGGSCFPKDVRALDKIAEDSGYDFKLLKAAMAVNVQQHHSMISKISDHFGGNLSGKIFALWGLAFKPNTDDIRDAPALAIVDELLERGAIINAYDPEAAANVARKYVDTHNLKIIEDKYTALEKANGLIIATEWPEFIEADIAVIADTMQKPVIFDGRNIYQPSDMQSAGFSYYSVGRRPVIQ